MSDEVKLLPCENTDRELWCEREGDYYANSIHVTAQGGIGINVGGTVIVKTLREWHSLATRTIEATVTDCPVCNDRSTFSGDPASFFCDEHYRLYLATFQIHPKDLGDYRAKRIAARAVIEATRPTDTTDVER